MADRLLNSFRVIELLANNNSTSIREFSRILNIPRSTVHRILQDLIKYNIVEFDKRTQQYSWGKKLTNIARQVCLNNDLRRFSISLLRKIRDEVNERAVLAVFDIKSGTYSFLEAAQCNQPVRFETPMGIPIPLFSGAGGKAIMAFISEKNLHKIEKRLIDRVPNIKIELNSLKNELEQVRKKLYSFSHGEVSVDAIGIASPIFDASNSVIGSILITLPSYRFDEKKRQQFTKLTQNTAKQLSSIMGFSEGYPPVKNLVDLTYMLTTYCEKICV